MSELSTLILCAFALDFAVGDPRWLPHPVNAIASVARKIEGVMRRSSIPPLWGGGVTAFSVLVIVGVFTVAVLSISGQISPWLRRGATLYLLYASLACRGLISHALTVKKSLERGDLEEARSAVGMIVGRETAIMEEDDVTRATLESVGENMIDGVTAPLLSMLLFGCVGVWVYKAASTLDSLMGYRNERYILFGRIAAKVDDFLAFLPARLTLPFTAAAAFVTERISPLYVWKTSLKYRKCHASPNAAHGEAALAAALGLRFGGPVIYGGEEKLNPYIGDGRDDFKPGDIDRGIRVMTATSLLFLAGGVLIREGILWVL